MVLRSWWEKFLLSNVIRFHLWNHSFHRLMLLICAKVTIAWTFWSYLGSFLIWDIKLALSTWGSYDYLVPTSIYWAFFAWGYFLNRLQRRRNRVVFSWYKNSLVFYNRVLIRSWDHFECIVFILCSTHCYIYFWMFLWLNLGRRTFIFNNL